MLISLLVVLLAIAKCISRGSRPAELVPRSTQRYADAAAAHTCEMMATDNRAGRHLEGMAVSWGRGEKRTRASEIEFNRRTNRPERRVAERLHVIEVRADRITEYQ